MIDWIDNLKLKICGAEIKHCKEVLEKINLIRNGQYAVLTANDLRIIQEELEERLARNETNYIEAGGKTADLKEVAANDNA